MDKVITRENLKDYHNRVVAPMQGTSLTNGTGAIPAYIVGNTMTKGWLSLEENGTALIPTDKQEYIILTSGDWLRKHVMWFEDLGVYRLTGKVGIVTERKRAIVTGGDTESISVNTNSQLNYGVERLDGSVIAKANGVIQVSLKLTCSANDNGMALVIKKGDTVVAEVKNKNYGSQNGGNYASWSGTINVEDSDIGKTIGVYAKSISSSGVAAITGTITQDYQDVFSDYETDDIINITEAEIDAIWNETAGEPTPKNNVFSTEERLCGYWIDGKPIYRKVVEFDVNQYTTAGERKSFDLAEINGVGVVVNHYAMYSSVDDRSIYLSGVTFQGTNPMKPQWTTYCFVTNGKLTCRLQTLANVTSTAGHVVIEYTKTTD